MKKTIGFGDFCQEFRAFNREDNFSYEGKKALFDFFEEIDEDMELDIIGICSEFSEYESLEDFQDSYGEEYQSIDDINNMTIVIEIEDSEGFIIQDF